MCFIKLLCSCSGATSQDQKGAWKKSKEILGQYQQHLRNGEIEIVSLPK